MDTVWKGAACAVLALVLGIAVEKKDKDISILLSIAVCCMLCGAALQYLQPVFSFFQTLQTAAGLDSDLLGILLKVVGIGMVCQISTLVCNDAGNAALGKALQLLSAAVILWISIPLMQSLLSLIEDILGGL